MELNYIRQLYEYNQWADRRVLGAVGKLPSDVFLRPAGNSFPSILDTVAHILRGEWIWLERWRGRESTALVDGASFPSLESLQSRWESVARDQTDFISTLTPQRLNEDVGYINRQGQHFSYPLWQQMLHVVNHSSYHRGQITTLLRQAGAEIVPTDFLVYYDEKPVAA